jgi:hypothetical protein
MPLGLVIGRNIVWGGARARSCWIGFFRQPIACCRLARPAVLISLAPSGLERISLSSPRACSYLMFISLRHGISGGKGAVSQRCAVGENTSPPSFLATFLNVTMPVGLRINTATLAVRVTGCPKLDGFCDEPKPVSSRLRPPPALPPATCSRRSPRHHRTLR